MEKRKKKTSFRQRLNLQQDLCKMKNFCNYPILFAIILSGICFIGCSGNDSSSGPEESAIIESSSNQESSSSTLQSEDSKVTSSSSAEDSVTSSSDKESTVSDTTPSSSSEERKLAANYDPATQTLTDNRDGKVYKTTTIGEQIWMAENLNFEYKPTSIDDYFLETYCANGTPEGCEKYGSLYNHYTVYMIDVTQADSIYPFVPDSLRPYTGVCPEGWHVPSSAEWSLLFDNVPNLLDLYSEEIGGNNKTGFNILFGGYRADAEYVLEGNEAYFATIDMKNKISWVVVRFNIYSGEGETINHLQQVSVRCLMN